MQIGPAVHATRAIPQDPLFERGLASHLKQTSSSEEIAGLYGRFAAGTSAFDGMMRRVVWCALSRSFGNGVTVSAGAMFRHLETISIGDGVFIGEGAMLQGHALGNAVIEDRVWIGPLAYVDARDVVIGRSAALAPGAKILCSEHTGVPVGLPVNATANAVSKVTIGAGADIGVGAIVLPGCTIGEGAIVGAGAVVTGDVPPRAVVAGVPARLLRMREEQAS
jgi:acetyltransferase-like isoleucine patch superfamily enzyme